MDVLIEDARSPREAFNLFVAGPPWLRPASCRRCGSEGWADPEGTLFELVLTRDLFSCRAHHCGREER